MPTTPIFALPTPSLGDANNVPASMLALANQLESVLDGTRGTVSGRGDWRRLPDGTQICTLNISVTNHAITSAYGSGFISSTPYDWLFPRAFTVAPAVAVGQFRWGTGASWGSVVSVDSSSAVLRAHDLQSRATGTPTTISAIAVGRWK